MTGMSPVASSVLAFWLEQIGLVLFNADLIHAWHCGPESREFLHLTGVAVHAYHLNHYLHLRAPFVLHPRESHEVVANLFESRSLAVVFVGSFRGAVEAERDVLDRRGQQ